MLLGELPNASMKERVVTNLITGYVRAVKFTPRNFFKSVGPHSCEIFELSVPVSLIGPKGDVN
jgi:hypothetical protein